MGPATPKLVRVSHDARPTFRKLQRAAMRLALRHGVARPDVRAAMAGQIGAIPPHDTRFRNRGAEAIFLLSECATVLRLLDRGDVHRAAERAVMIGVTAERANLRLAWSGTGNRARQDRADARDRALADEVKAALDRAPHLSISAIAGAIAPRYGVSGRTVRRAIKK